MPALQLAAPNLWSLVLAGGDGTRLRELTRQISGTPIPKQYCRIHAGRSLVEATLARIAPLAPPRRTLVIVTSHHLNLAREQLAVLPADNVLVQPFNRETGPGLLFPLLELQRRDRAATVAIFPSDHYVADDAAFLRHVQRAERLVADDAERVALLGIRPEWPEPGYGYIEPGRQLPGAGPRAFGVAAFREKPSHEAAVALINRGGLWNSFVMVARVSRLLELVAGVRPADYAVMQTLVASGRIAHGYAAITPWNFSSDFLAHVAHNLAVVETDGTGWSDWGTREAIERTLTQLQYAPAWMRHDARARSSSASVGASPNP